MVVVGPVHSAHYRTGCPPLRKCFSLPVARGSVLVSGAGCFFDGRVHRVQGCLVFLPLEAPGFPAIPRATKGGNFKPWLKTGLFPATFFLEQRTRRDVRSRWLCPRPDGNRHGAARPNDRRTVEKRLDASPRRRALGRRTGCGGQAVLPEEGRLTTVNCSARLRLAPRGIHLDE